MNKSMSFCVRNPQGLVSLTRILTVKPDGACYINYEHKNSTYHASFHPPDKNHGNGQMHIKTSKKIIFKREIHEFYNFNAHRCFESVMIIESELWSHPLEIPKSVKILELPENHMVHIMFMRSDKAYGHIEAAFISDKPTSQPDERIIPYPVFYGIEDMPEANYYLTYNIQPIDKTVSDYIASVKMQYIKSRPVNKESNHIFHVRHPFLSTDMEICITKDIIKTPNLFHYVMGAVTIYHCAHY